ncbi:hypothetical protein OEZ60_15685 [Defluviimonas sp. WL0024]|uniref:Uncharacterized protein n=1 Tax=Albidovulum salinarum TaxID=2984153 RepID=A0ABT2X8X1_9RHOB|nr:hypothetical protein [Defluviimonas sp. WL0024]MCU9849442.1 hypothetical protein [Defluviimonas sp. WL0024]
MTQVLPVSFSCIVDRPQSIQSAAVRWANALIRIEGVDPSRIFIQSVDKDLPVLDHFRALGTNVIPVDRFGDGKHCNKLVQFDCHERFEDGAIALFDCDTVCSGTFSETVSRRFRKRAGVSGHRFAMGKTVDAPNPPADLFLRLRDHFKINAEFRMIAGTLERDLTPEGYFNGGLYCLPTALAGEFGGRWKEWAGRLLGSSQAKIILDSYFWHVDQISFYFAALDAGLDFEILDNTFNCATHYVWPQVNENSDPPRVIHYHHNLRSDGRIGTIGSRTLDRATNRVNDVLAPLQAEVEARFGLTEQRPFKNWIEIEPTMSITSQNLSHLHALLRLAGIETARSVAEHRCASARHIEGLDVKEYAGFEERAAYAESARQRLPGHHVESRGLTRSDRAEMVICLDLAGALETFKSIEALVDELALAASHSVLLAGECVSTALLGDDPEITLDVAGSLRRSGQFQHVMSLARHGGRDVFLALKPAAVSALVADGPAGTGRLLDASADSAAVLRTLLAARAARSGAAGEAAIDAASLIELPWIVRTLEDNLEARRIGLVGPELTPVSAGLSGCGASLVTMTADAVRLSFTKTGNASGNAQKTGGTNDMAQAKCDAWVIDRSIWRTLANDRAAALSRVTHLLNPGGMLLFTFDLEKRTNNLTSADGSLLTLERVLAEIEAMGYHVQSKRIVPMPFSIPNDLALVQAIYVGAGVPHIVSSKALKRSRTPESLRNFERRIRHMIRGTKANG